MRRRLTLVAAAATLGLTLAGCGGAADKPAESAAPPSEATGKVGVFTWWADGSEKVGLDALVGVFNKDYPKLTFDNLAVAGGAGSQAKSVLAAQLKAGNPPDSFQAHAGAELQDYIDAEQLEDLSSFYADNKLTDQFPKDLVDRLTVDGKIYSVPSNIHRANVVWANVEVLKKAGLDPAKPAENLDAWFADMDKIKATGKTPLAVAGSWTQVQLFENILLSSLGVDGYNGLWDGKTDWKGADVTKAIEAYKKALSYTNTDRDSLSDWAPATQLVQDGAAAYNVMGDWAEAKFAQDGDKAGVDYTYFPTPGTAGRLRLPRRLLHPAGRRPEPGRRQGLADDRWLRRGPERLQQGQGLHPGQHHGQDRRLLRVPEERHQGLRPGQDRFLARPRCRSSGGLAQRL